MMAGLNGEYRLKTIHPISAMIHHAVADEIEPYKPKSLIDIGGTDRLKGLVPCNVTNVNLSQGIDGTDLPFEDQEFDISVSIATVEHVYSYEVFLQEAFRVCRLASIHWFPVGGVARTVEKIKFAYRWHHRCHIRSDHEILQCLEDLGYVRSYPLQTAREHLLLLTTLKQRLNVRPFHRFARSCEGYYGKLYIVERVS